MKVPYMIKYGICMQMSCFIYESFRDEKGTKYGLCRKNHISYMQITYFIYEIHMKIHVSYMTKYGLNRKIHI